MGVRPLEAAWPFFYSKNFVFSIFGGIFVKNSDYV